MFVECLCQSPRSYKKRSEIQEKLRTRDCILNYYRLNYAYLYTKTKNISSMTFAGKFSIIENRTANRDHLETSVRRQRPKGQTQNARISQAKGQITVFVL